MRNINHTLHSETEDADKSPEHPAARDSPNTAAASVNNNNNKNKNNNTTTSNTSSTAESPTAPETTDKTACAAAISASTPPTASASTPTATPAIKEEQMEVGSTHEEDDVQINCKATKRPRCDVEVSHAESNTINSGKF